jgi:DNA end-binding protein Ku
VIDSLVGDFEPEELTSDYRRDLKAMLEAKLAGEELVVEPEPEKETPVVDLMEALKRSVAEVEQKPAKRARAASKGGSRKRAPARKSA